MNPLPSMKVSNASGISWRRDVSGTIVVNELDGRAHRITGIAEVIWDCLLLSYPYPKIIDVVSQLTSSTLAGAEEETFAHLCEWRDLGLLTVQEE